MSDTQHTPVPWLTIAAQEPSDGGIDYAILTQIDGVTVCIAEAFEVVDDDVRVNAKANAEFIVRACNSHDELVEELQLVKAMVESIHTMKGLRVWATEENRENKRLIIDRIAAALAKARGVS